MFDFFIKHPDDDGYRLSGDFYFFFELVPITSNQPDKSRSNIRGNFMKPNLFHFSTSELSQDAFICWLFEHIRLKSNDIAYTVAKHFLEGILDKFTVLKPAFTAKNLFDYTLKIEQQVHHIDILLTFESNIGSENIYMIIEDKIHSGESRENQPEYYAGILKVKDSGAVIIPVLFKTGFATKEEKRNFEDRKVVFIGYDDIYDIFSNYTHEMKNDVILNSWWANFNEKFYTPIQQAKSLSISPSLTLNVFNQRIRENAFPEMIVFQKVTDYLFHQIAGGFLTNTYSVQGKGHIDWHFELRKPSWTSTEKNIATSVYFIWDTYNFSLVIKTSPFQYKPFKKLTDDEKKDYIMARESIKSEIRKNEQIDWKMTNYYLQIVQMNRIHSIPLGRLKEKINREIMLISNEIDRIMGS
jgi:hypothetical protein